MAWIEEKRLLADLLLIPPFLEAADVAVTDRAVLLRNPVGFMVCKFWGVAL